MTSCRLMTLCQLNLWQLALLLSIAGTLGCASNAPEKETLEPIPSMLDTEISRSHWTYPPMSAHAQAAPNPKPEDTWFDFQNRSPLEFLEFCARMGEKPKVPNNPWASMLVFKEIHRGWVQKSDLPALFARIDDERPGPTWMLETCSMIPYEPRTVGDHALALISAYHAEQVQAGYGGFPSSLSSDFLSKIDRSAFEAYLEEK